MTYRKRGVNPYYAPHLVFKRKYVPQSLRRYVLPH
nr:MAG TPA: hypothetical protein [Caudoviricetes sp.]